MPNSSATLTVWASAWRAGAVAPDDVLDALEAWAPLQRAHAGDRVATGRTGLPEPGDGAVGAAALFTALRGVPADGLHLVLPVPGDVRGLPPGTDFAGAALARGQGVLAPSLGLGLVPVPEGEEMVRWVAYAVPGDAAVPDHVGLGEAEHGLRQATRDTARAVTELDVAGGDVRHVRGRIAAVLRARPALRWPAATPPRALRVLDQADEVAAILTDRKSVV